MYNDSEFAVLYAAEEPSEAQYAKLNSFLAEKYGKVIFIETR